MPRKRPPPDVPSPPVAREGHKRLQDCHNAPSAEVVERNRALAAQDPSIRLDSWGRQVAYPGSAGGIPNDHNPNVLCEGKTTIRDEEGRPMLDPFGHKMKRPCRAYAIHGSVYCTGHGGMLARVKVKAATRLQAAADKVSRELVKMAMDPLMDPRVRLRAITEVLDRAGVSGKTEIEVTLKPWQEMLSAITEGREPTVDLDDDEWKWNEDVS